MKKIFVLMLFASAFFGVSASAQKHENHQGGGMGVGKQFLIDSLGLSDAAADSVVAITRQSVIHVRNIMKDESLSQDEKREKAKPIKEEAKTRLKQFLTPEQMRKLQQMEMERRQNRANQQ
jgi:hypothetical protein